MQLMKTLTKPGFRAMFASLLVFWLLVSARLDYQHLAVGAAFSFLITLFWREFLMNIEQRKDVLPYKVLFSRKSLVYFLSLLVEIVKANINIARIVLDPRLPISPVVITMHTSLSRDLTKVMYANSITLTPGTISMGLTGDKLVVHCLTQEGAESVHHWVMEDKLKAIERDLEID